MKKAMLLLLLVFLVAALSSCKKKNVKDSTEKADSTQEATNPFEDLVNDDVTNIKIYVEGLVSEITLSKNETTQMIDLLNKLVINEEVRENDTLIGQMIHITVLKTDDTSILVKCLTPYVIINGTWYDAEYETCENLNKFVNELISK